MNEGNPFDRPFGSSFTGREKPDYWANSGELKEMMTPEQRAMTEKRDPNGSGMHGERDSHTLPNRSVLREEAEHHNVDQPLEWTMTNFMDLSRITNFGNRAINSGETIDRLKELAKIMPIEVKDTLFTLAILSPDGLVNIGHDRRNLEDFLSFISPENRFHAMSELVAQLQHISDQEMRSALLHNLAVIASAQGHPDAQEFIQADNLLRDHEEAVRKLSNKLDPILRYQVEEKT